jgi:hypothetical protein
MPLCSEAYYVTSLKDQLGILLKINYQFTATIYYTPDEFYDNYNRTANYS